jgi:hypothetical protein
MQQIAITRFSNETFDEYIRYVDNSKISNFYNTPVPIAKRIQIGASIIVLEANIEENKMMGFGMIKNNYVQYYKHNVYKYKYRNRLSYVGGYSRVDISEMTTQEKKVMRIFEIVCFTGARHMKRGIGIQCINEKQIERCKPKIDLYAFLHNSLEMRKK